MFLDRPQEIIIVDILNARSNLPRHIAALTTLKSYDR